MKKQLGWQESEKLSRIMGIDKQVIVTLSERGILNTTECRSILIRSDYKRILSEGKHSGSHIIGALVKEYGLSRSSVELIIYNKKPNKMCSCTRCGNPVSKYKFSRYGGLCEACLVAEIKID